MIKYYIISGLNLNDNNRGTAALGYGAFSFLKEYHNTEGYTPINFLLYKKPWKYKFKSKKEDALLIGEEKVVLNTFFIWFIDYWIYKNIPFLSRYTKMGSLIKGVKFVAAINGGDGFSDIYGTATFESRLFDTKIAMKENIPLIILPQTLGPFTSEKNLVKAEEILKYAFKVYVRDLKFELQLKKMGVEYELTKDLSFYMKPQKIDFEIKQNAVGINISGLCYFNQFRELSGRFNLYPQLIMQLINRFQDENIPIYLISHSYNYKKPEFANDDLSASKEVFKNLKNKSNIYLIDNDYISPQVKYIISKCSFFIGTRMHANFAAIYTEVPVFGLAYSYKYEGAFKANSLNDSYSMIIDISEEDIPLIIDKIMDLYIKREEIKTYMKKISCNIQN